MARSYVARIGCWCFLPFPFLNRCFQRESLCKWNYYFLSQGFEEKNERFRHFPTHPPILDFIQICCAHDNILALTNGKLLDVIVEYRCVVSLPFYEDISYDFLLCSLLGYFLYQINNILQSILIFYRHFGVFYRHYTKILFLRLLKALLLKHDKKSISKWIITLDPCHVETQAHLQTKHQALILQHDLSWCFPTHHSNGISAVGMEILVSFDYMILGKLLWHH